MRVISEEVLQTSVRDTDPEIDPYTHSLTRLHIDRYVSNQTNDVCSTGRSVLRFEPALDDGRYFVPGYHVDTRILTVKRFENRLDARRTELEEHPGTRSVACRSKSTREYVVILFILFTVVSW